VLGRIPIYQNWSILMLYQVLCHAGFVQVMENLTCHIILLVLKLKCASWKVTKKTINFLSRKVEKTTDKSENQLIPVKK